MKSFFAIVLLLSASAWGTDYYVDAANGNDALNNGSPFAPFRTISRAANAGLQPGDVVHVAAGVYNEQVLVTASGSASSPLSFVCDQPRQCRIIGQYYAHTNVYGLAAVLLVGNFINVSGFDVMTDASGTAGILGYGASGGYAIVNNYVHDVPIPRCDANGGAGIDPEGTGEGGHSYIAQNVVVNIGFASHCGRANGIYLAGNGTVAVNNLVYNSWGSGIDVAHAASNVVVAFNTVYGIRRGNGIGGDGVYLGCDTRNCDNNMIANNILVNNENAGIESYQATVRIPSPRNVLRNNLLYGNGTACLFPVALAPGASGCAGNINVNPNFVNPSRGDFHLSQCSPAAGSASSDEAPLMDLDGNARPSSGRGHDIGAYAYTGPSCGGGAQGPPSSPPTPGGPPTPAPNPEPHPPHRPPNKPLPD